MTPTTPAHSSTDAVPMGLFARIVGVITSPRATYAAVAANPRWLGVACVVLLVVAIGQGIFLSSEVGQQIALDQSIEGMEAFGMTVTDEIYDQMEAGMYRARFTGPISQFVVVPIVWALLAGLCYGVFTMIMGGGARFKQVYAIMAHSGVIYLLQQLFGLPLSYAREAPARANLAAFAPMLDETSFVARFLGAADLFVIWSFISIAIGLSVLYKRRTSGIALSLLGIYAVIAAVIAFAFSRA